MMSRLAKLLKNHWVLLVLFALQLLSFFCAKWEPTGLLYLKREMLPYSIKTLYALGGLSALAGVLCAVMKTPFLPSNKTLGRLYLLLAAAYLLWTAYAPCENWPFAPFWVWAFCGIACWCSAVLGRFSGVVFVFCLPAAGVTSMAQMFDMEVCPGNIMEVICTSMEDAAPYLTFTTFALLFLIITCSVLVAWFTTRLLHREKCLTKLFTGSVFLLLSMGEMYAQGFYRCPNKTLYFWPVGCTVDFSLYTQAALEYVSKIRSALAHVPDKESTGAVRGVKAEVPVICILHIGESVRYDHLGLAGWRHDTTPWLGKQERLINFTDCTASASQTDRATLTIMTNARRDIATAKPEEYPTSGGLMDFFAASGFNCAAFWGSDLKDNDVPLFKAEALFFSRATKDIFSCLELPWKQAADILAYTGKHADRDNFLLVNNIGSHYPFTFYDEASAPFRPAEAFRYDAHPEKDAALGERYINAYDNSIHYTDEYIRRLLTGLQGKPFLYLYLSDHGEYLGDNGVWTRGRASDSAFFKGGASHIPFFVYASPEFEAAHPHYKEALEQLKRHADMPTGQEHIFHTLLGLFGIQTPYYDKTLDLSNESAQPYTGPHHSGR